MQNLNLQQKDFEKIEDHLKFKDYFEFSQPLKSLKVKKQHIASWQLEEATL